MKQCPSNKADALVWQRMLNKETVIKVKNPNGNIVASTPDGAVSTDLGPMNQSMTPDGFYNFVLANRVLSELGTIKKKIQRQY